MKREEIFEKVKDILVEQLGVRPDQVEEQSNFQHDLGTDSLDEVEIIMALEEDFVLEISEDDALQAATVGELVDLIEAKQNEISQTTHS
jgi:acyl carrier protein